MTALHVVFLNAAPAEVFGSARAAPLDLDAEGLDRLTDHIAASLQAPTRVLGLGHLGAASRYDRAGLRYGPTQLCNHWVSDGLNAAGPPSPIFWSALPRGGVWELSLRGGRAR